MSPLEVICLLDDSSDDDAVNADETDSRPTSAQKIRQDVTISMNNNRSRSSSKDDKNNKLASNRGSQQPPSSRSSSSNSSSGQWLTTRKKKKQNRSSTSTTSTTSSSSSSRVSMPPVQQQKTTTPNKKRTVLSTKPLSSTTSRAKTPYTTDLDSSDDEVLRKVHSSTSFHKNHPNLHPPLEEDSKPPARKKFHANKHKASAAYADAKSGCSSTSDEEEELSINISSPTIIIKPKGRYKKTNNYSASKKRPIKVAKREASALNNSSSKPTLGSDTNSSMTPTIEFLKHHCWTCHVQLRHPHYNTTPSNKDDQNILLWSVLHAHLALQVPCCVACVKDIATAEATPSDAVCCGCGQDDDFLLLCDNDDCPRAMCQGCITQAHQDTTTFQQLTESDDEWKCCKCAPPQPLRVLQQDFLALQEEEAPQLSMAELLGELETIEAEKKICEEELDGDEQVRSDIRQEFMQVHQGFSGTQLQETVEEEVEQWRYLKEQHYIRLMDAILSTQEQLEGLGYNLREFFFETIEKKDGIDEDSDEEAWVRKANRAVEKLERKRELDDEAPPTPREYDTDEAYDNVDELGSLSGSENGREAAAPLRFRWKGKLGKPTQKDWDAAYKSEEQTLAAKNITVSRRVADSDDRKETVEEESQVIRSLVRRDHAVAVRQRREAEAASRRSPTSTTKSKSSAMEPRQNSNREKRETNQQDSRPRNRITDQPVGPNKEKWASIQQDPAPQDMDTDEPIIPAAPNHSIFHGPSFLLTGPEHSRQIAVAEPLTRLLKSHQKEGIEFMWKNTFADLAYSDTQSDDAKKQDIGGCILAHNMGLGKSFSTVALLHTMMFHPSLKDHAIQTVLLIVPVNTLTNWENEFDKWTKDLKSSSITVWNLADCAKAARGRILERWSKKGGVLLSSGGLFQTASKTKEYEEYLKAPGPDVIVIDEAHTMLKNNSSQVFKALMEVQTPRRLCLTGSPFQNNLFEYFRMVTYVRPGLLGNSERKFEYEYVQPIVTGMSSDASDLAKQVADEKLSDLQEKLEPFVHRKDATVLLKDLPPMQQVVLHVRQTKVQSRLYGAFKRFRRSSEGHDSNNFFKLYSALRPIHNHPACLIRFQMAKQAKNNTMAKPKKGENVNDVGSKKSKENVKKLPSGKSTHPTKAFKQDPGSSVVGTRKAGTTSRIIETIDLISDSEEESDLLEEAAAVNEPVETKDWWMKVAKRDGIEKLADPANGNKIVLLLHILTQASILDEKVVVFSQCLKTLDFIAEVLAREKWQNLVHSIASTFPGYRIGGWKSGRDFLRIDGSNSGAERGEKVKEFNEDLSCIRLFLISSRAGGIGINLCSANRVVLFDSHFNPTIDNQALYRCYRYGQKKSVFAYRFLTEGSMEEKVYSRAVNKSSLALSLVDGKNLQRCFTKDEIDDLKGTFDWVLCEKCSRWRVFPPECNIDTSTLSDNWFCKMMNEHDKRMILDCTFPEKDEPWYNSHFRKPNESPGVSSPMIAMTSGGTSASLSKEKMNKLVDRDEILKGLLDVSSSDRKSNVVSKHYFHDALFDDKELEDDAKSHCSETDEAKGPCPPSKQRPIQPTRAKTPPPISDTEIDRATTSSKVITAETQTSSNGNGGELSDTRTPLSRNKKSSSDSSSQQPSKSRDCKNIADAVDTSSSIASFVSPSSRSVSNASSSPRVSAWRRVKVDFGSPHRSRSQKRDRESLQEDKGDGQILHSMDNNVQHNDGRPHIMSSSKAESQSRSTVGDQDSVSTRKIRKLSIASEKDSPILQPAKKKKRLVENMDDESVFNIKGKKVAAETKEKKKKSRSHSSLARRVLPKRIRRLFHDKSS